MSDTVDYLLKCTMETLRGKLRSSRHPDVLRKALADAKEDLTQLIGLALTRSTILTVPGNSTKNLGGCLERVNRLLSMSDNVLRGAAASFFYN